MRPGEDVQRILSVEFCEAPIFDSMVREIWRVLIRILDCLNREAFDYELHQEAEPFHIDRGPYSRSEHTRGSDSPDAVLEHPCLELKKTLSGGTFYYSLTFDLTNRLQNRYVEAVISRF